MRNVAAELLALVATEKVFTDIHIQESQPVMIKAPKGWEVEDSILKFESEDIYDFLKLVDPEWETKIKRQGISRAYDLTKCRLRVNAYRVNAGRDVSISIRRQPIIPPELKSSGLPLFTRKIVDRSKGLIIVTGPTGSGKTTTLASMVRHINQTRAVHIETIEDPIEYVHTRERAIISQKEVPVDVPSFEEGLKDALRHKPDVIMVGEIRDRATADVAMMAGESGHLVLASMHTSTVTGAITKLINFFPGEGPARCKMLADSLLMVVCQCLIPSKEQDEFVLACEVLTNDKGQSQAILSSPDKLSGLYEFMARKSDQQSWPMERDLERLVREGRISEADAFHVAPNVLKLNELIQR